MDINIENVIIRLNDHILKNKLKKTDILDDSRIYLDIDDFKELFKRIRFDITSSELNSVFKYKNNSYEEGYIFGKIFTENCILENLPYDETFETKKTNKKINTENKLDFKEINHDLKEIMEEVNKIVEKDTKLPPGSARLSNENRNQSARNKSVRENISNNKNGLEFKSVLNNNSK